MPRMAAQGHEERFSLSRLRVRFGATARAGRRPRERQITDGKADARTLRRKGSSEWTSDLRRDVSGRRGSADIGHRIARDKVAVVRWPAETIRALNMSWGSPASVAPGDAS